MDAGVLGDLLLCARVPADRGFQFVPHAQNLAGSLMVSQAKVLAGALMAGSPDVSFRRQPNQEELAARIRAAQGYAGLDRKAMAKVLNTTPATLDRKLRKRQEVSALTWDDAWAVADATGLPLAFFAADFDRLHELVPDDVPLPASRVIEEAAKRSVRRRREQRGASEETPGAPGASGGAA